MQLSSDCMTDGRSGLEAPFVPWTAQKRDAGLRPDGEISACFIDTTLTFLCLPRRWLWSPGRENHRQDYGTD